MSTEVFTVDYPDYKISFEPYCGGFPSSMVLKLRNGKEHEILDMDEPWLKIVLEHGKTVQPVLTPDVQPAIRSSGDTTWVEFWNIPFMENGSPMHNWLLNLSYEFNSDGVGFLNLFFTAKTAPQPVVTSFRLQIPMNLDAKTVSYGYWDRLKDVDGSVIQAISSVSRNCTEKQDIKLDNTIVPQIEFNYGSNDAAPSRHIEWLMEGQNSLYGDAYNTFSKLLWKDGEPTLLYEFVKDPVQPRERPYQWRNRLCFVLGQTPKVRNKAPLRLYHDIDLYTPFPTTHQIQKMAAEGADALVLHEGWRIDVQNGGAPRDAEAIKRVIRDCHDHGIRVALYIRSDELSVYEDCAFWFDNLLTKNFDGLYADYGSPIGKLTRGDESYPGGRYPFREHYSIMKRIRNEVIGKDGIFILHTGPFFCGTVLGSVLDAYTAGEGEKGVMLSSRRDNAYFSGSTVGAGSLWTAAFPDYCTPKMNAYMANIGQFPHVTMGKQIESSSLAHSNETGNITYARALWKYYGLMAGERDVGFSNDLCDEMIYCDSLQTGAAVYSMQDGSRLLLLSNFRSEEADCSVQAPLILPGTNQACFMLFSDQSGPSYAKKESAGIFSMKLPAFGVGALLICEENSKWQLRLEQFAKPYPLADEADLAYKKQVEDMDRLRFSPAQSKELYLRVHIPSQDLGWEDSIWWDLYNTSYTLYMTPKHDERQKIGYIGLNGFMQEKPKENEYLWPGHETPWIALHELLPRGVTLVELRADHFGEDFYSFVIAELSDESKKDIRTLKFMNELESDRSRLTFKIHL